MKSQGQSGRIQALKHCQIIAKAIEKHGSKTNKELAEILDGVLDSITVTRRLKSSNVWSWPGSGYFQYDNTTQKWSLTERGRELIKEKL